MSDLVKRLRDYASNTASNLGGISGDYLTWQAADRIEALEAALHKIDDITIDHTAMGIARKALASAALAPERRCAKCGCTTKSEEALVGGETWCHPCADLAPEPDKMPDGFANLRAIMADQPYRNSGLSVHEIEVILANKGGFMPDEATVWFREARGRLGIAPEQDK